MSEDFFEDFFKDKNKKQRKESNKNVLDKLYKVPKKDKGVNMPHFRAFKPNQVHQADLLFLPEDEGYKYALVVVDINNRRTDAEPLKNKTPSDVLTAFKTIYARGILKLPAKIEVDAGSEFRGAVAKYFHDNDVTVRVAKTGRHRQQGMVERRNQIIGKALFKRMAGQELLTGETSKEWVEDLPKLIKAMNKKTEGQKVKELPDAPVCEGDSCKLLGIGDKVRVALDGPKDVADLKRLHGRFRSTDIRFDPTIRTIKEVLLKPGYPPMYLLDGNVGARKVEPVAYTKNQLQLVDKEEKYPSGDLIKNINNKKTFTVEKLVGHKKEDGKLYLRVRWLGFKEKDDTYEPALQLMKEIPDLVKEYKKQHKLK
jgi:hypothetical protein